MLGRVHTFSAIENGTTVELDYQGLLCNKQSYCDLKGSLLTFGTVYGHQRFIQVLEHVITQHCQYDISCVCTYGYTVELQVGYIKDCTSHQTKTHYTYKLLSA